MTIDDLLEVVKKYNPDELEKVKKAYQYAEVMHENQYRQSGEPYIIHPLNVAYILAELHADGATLCAGLLHDTLEDTSATKEDLKENFGSLVANLVDGVTNFSKNNFHNREDEISANTRKIVNAITSDARIIIIKLADRLHNMRTLEFKNHDKQKEKALETLEVFIPLAYYTGVNKIKSELEDLSLKYLKPDDYKKSEEIKLSIEETNLPNLEKTIYQIHTILNAKHIPNEIKYRIKNIYGVYKRKVLKTSDSHDLIAIKVMVDEVDNCYRTLGFIHSLYTPINGKFKDYICSPKTNMYSSLHTTVFGGNSNVVQMQIRTFDMDFIATNGLPAYWDLNKGDAKKFMQNKITDNALLTESLKELNRTFKNNQEFVKQVKKDLFNDQICVYTMNGKKIFLPNGSTIIDFAYIIHTEIGNHTIGAIVNGQDENINYVLQNNDCIRIITSKELDGPDISWLDIAQTSHARKKIKDFYKKK